MIEESVSTRSSITLWYRRHECGFRIAIFFSAATAAGAFGGLLARGIMEMDGVAGVEGWGWIFILEGILTVVVGEYKFVALGSYQPTYYYQPAFPSYTCTTTPTLPNFFRKRSAQRLCDACETITRLFPVSFVPSSSKMLSVTGKSMSTVSWHWGTFCHFTRSPSSCLRSSGAWDIPMKRPNC
jgi:hypothetical protein